MTTTQNDIAEMIVTIDCINRDFGDLQSIQVVDYPDGNLSTINGFHVYKMDNEKPLKVGDTLVLRLERT